MKMTPSPCGSLPIAGQGSPKADKLDVIGPRFWVSSRTPPTKFISAYFALVARTATIRTFPLHIWID
jgi:hypothetical protein